MPTSPGKQRFYARVCWNSEGWLRPTGEAAKLETNSYAATDGFGHEEWLFNYGAQLGDYQYGFLQPVHRSWNKYAGTVMDLILWAINPAGERVYIGEITNCEVLKEVEALKVLRQHKRAGLIRSMKLDVARVKGKSEQVDIDSLFNIRFKPSEAFQSATPYWAAVEGDRIWKVKRYLLTSASQSDLDGRRSLSRRAQARNLPGTAPYYNPGAAGGTVERYHAQLQTELLALLQSRFGKRVISYEVNGIDLLISGKSTVALLELKTHVVAKQAIREALGQVMEYGYFKQGSFPVDAVQLFILAPAPADEESKAYLSFLRDTFGLPVYYCPFSKGSPLPDQIAALNI